MVLIVAFISGLVTLVGLIAVLVFFMRISRKMKRKLAAARTPAAPPQTQETIPTERDLIAKTEIAEISEIRQDLDVFGNDNELVKVEDVKIKVIGRD